MKILLLAHAPCAKIIEEAALEYPLPMPHQGNLFGNAKIRAARLRGASRRRYEGAEKRRIALLEQLSHFDETVHAHPSYKCALTLLNQRFRRARIDQRTAILKAAQWLIVLIEMSSGIV